MIGTLIDQLTNSRNLSRDGDSLLLTTTEFNREVARERIRATRRSIPFCIVTIQLLGRKQLRTRRRTLARLLHRNLRLTDHKAALDRDRFAVLLVDTPEMGGRAVLDRLGGLCDSQRIEVELSLRVHDSEGFNPEDDSEFPSGNESRRVDDPQMPDWYRVDPGESNGASSLAVGLIEMPPVGTQERAVASTDRRSSSSQSGGVCVSSEELLIARPLVARVVKRSVDLVGASVGLLVASPVLLAASAAVKFTSPGPVLFTQTREGMAGRPFTIYKIRTMIVGAEGQQAELRKESHRDGPAFKIKRDPRVTRVGHFLRRTCIDELPQLINVLRGEMSLVGPRPLPWHESRACNQWHRRRLDVPPGMTCHWQVNKSAAESFDDWMRMDLQYVDRHGLWKDLRLIARTLIVPLTGRGSE